MSLKLRIMSTIKLRLYENCLKIVAVLEWELIEHQYFTKAETGSLTILGDYGLLSLVAF